MTPAELIRLALRDAGVNGVGQTPTAEDNNDVFTHLNMMLAEWSARRYLVFRLIDVSCAATGALSYTVGTGGNINTTRPDQIESAFWRATGSGASTDYPMVNLGAREDYSRIAVKTTGNWPSYFFYDPAYPLGNLYPWPVPGAGLGEIHLVVRSQLAQFADLTTDIAFPPAYLNALLWNLTQRIRPLYQLPPDRQVDGYAKASLAVLRSNNAEMPRLRMPAALAGGGRYNINTDGA